MEVLLSVGWFMAQLCREFAVLYIYGDTQEVYIGLRVSVSKTNVRVSSIVIIYKLQQLRLGVCLNKKNVNYKDFAH